MILLISLVFATCAFATQVVKRTPDGVPDFVVKYAPIVYLYSEDPWKPSDITSQLNNTEPRVDLNIVSDQPMTLDNLSFLNGLGGDNVYLTSKVKPYANPVPGYLLGVLPNGEGKTEGAVSSTIVVNDHGDGTVDAFYFYFYAFDRGALSIGNHVGDWEHSMIRFVNKTPSALWYSQHSAGQAFKYSAVQKYEDGAGNLRVRVDDWQRFERHSRLTSRQPIVYSANGSHANYATTGDHAYGIPNFNFPEGIIEDHTDKGPRWDPTLSAYWYSYNDKTKAFTPYNSK